MTAKVTPPRTRDGSDADVTASSLADPDPDAFAALFDRHSSHIHRYLARRLGRQAADDLVAETFLAAFHRRGDYDCHADRVAAQVTAQAMGQLMGTALAELSDGDRDVLLLIAWEGLAYDEVAGALDIPVGTVRSRLNRARRKVQLVLGSPENNPTSTHTQEIARHG
jgi:DNA-directed RNA polymerase specialized sigma24 family protein